MSITDDLKSIRLSGCLSGPKLMQFEITQRCPLHCPQCYKPPADEVKEMPLAEFKQHVDAAYEMGVKQISLLGGEPFMH